MLYFPADTRLRAKLKTLARLNGVRLRDLVNDIVTVAVEAAEETD